MNNATNPIRAYALIAASMFVVTAGANAPGKNWTARANAQQRMAAMNPSATTSGYSQQAMMSRRGGYNYGNGNRNAMAFQNNSQMISHLQATLATMAQADHDYQG